jgi:hypothetical protein
MFLDVMAEVAELTYGKFGVAWAAWRRRGSADGVYAKTMTVFTSAPEQAELSVASL